MLQLSRLRVLAEVHRCGSLTAAATGLRYTPSAISQQISRLERETGTVLLEKVGRGVRLTAAAVRLVGHAEEVMTRLELAEAELAAGDVTARGRLRVASFQTVLLELVPRALTWLAERHPELDVELIHREAGSSTDALLNHEFDVVLGEEFPGSPSPVQTGLHRVEVCSDPLRLALPEHPTAGGLPSTVGSLAELATARFSVDPVGMPMGDWVRSVCRGAGFEPLLRCETVDPLLQVQLVRTGHAAAFLPGLIAPGQLRGVNLFDLAELPRRSLYTLVRDGAVNRPGIVAVRSALEAAVQRLSRPAVVGQLAP